MTARSSRPTITAAMIVRNEERYLEECLQLAGQVVDEVVVVDTGSTDRTVEIARDAGATVHRIEWADDFAAARNTALDLASSEWILYIDADERVRCGPDDADLEAMADPSVIGALCRFSTHPDLTRYWEYRMFRNRPDVRFVGRIHETVRPALVRLEADGHRTVRTAATIDHLGYIDDQTAKHHRNRPLLERQVEADPTRAYLWYHLGSVRYGLGDEAGADTAWWAGVEAARARAVPEPLDLLCYSALALHHLDRSRRGDGERAGALEVARSLADEMRTRLPPSPQLDWVDANLALAEGRWGDALPVFHALTAIDPDELVDTRLAFQRDIFRAGAFHGIGVCHFETGRPDEAAQWFGAAERARPDVVEYRAKRIVAERRAASGPSAVARTGSNVPPGGS